MLLRRGLANHRKGTALSPADRLEALQVLGLDGEYIALLGFVAPDFQGGHTGFVIGHVAQGKTSAAPAILDQFGQRVGQAAGTDIVDKGDRVVAAQLPATVDHLLTASLHLGILALHRGEIEVLGAGAAGHGGGRAATQANEHCRAAQHDQVRARRESALLDMLLANIAVTAGDHDRFVVAPTFHAGHAGNIQLKAAEIAAEIGSAELVVERRAADRPLQHDVQGRDDARRLAVVRFPGLRVAGNLQVGYRKAGETHLGLGATPHRALVTDLTAGTGASAGKRRNGRGVVVRFHFHQQVNRLLGEAVLCRLRIRVEAAGAMSGHHGRVIGIRRQHTFTAAGIGVANHAEQGVRLIHTVDGPAGVEDLVTTVLGVGLREHHEFDITGVATQPGKRLHQIIDFVIGEGKAEAGIRCLQRGAAALQDINRRKRGGGLLAKQRAGRFQGGQYAFGHAIVQQGGHSTAGLRGERCRHRKIPGHTPLHPTHLGKAAVVDDVGCLAGPRRDRARTGHHQQQRPLDRRRSPGAIAE